MIFKTNLYSFFMQRLYNNIIIILMVYITGCNATQECNYSYECKSTEKCTDGYCEKEETNYDISAIIAILYIIGIIILPILAGIALIKYICFTHKTIIIEKN